MILHPENFDEVCALLKSCRVFLKNLRHSGGTEPLVEGCECYSCMIYGKIYGKLLEVETSLSEFCDKKSSEIVEDSSPIG